MSGDSKVFATRIQLWITAGTCLLGLAVQFTGVVWWAATVNAELKTNTLTMLELKRVVELEKDKAAPLAPQMGFLSAQILDLKSSLNDMRNELKDVNRRAVK